MAKPPVTTPITFDPSNPFAVPLPAGANMAAGLPPPPAFDLNTLFALIQKARAGQGQASPAPSTPAVPYPANPAFGQPLLTPGQSPSSLTLDDFGLPQNTGITPAEPGVTPGMVGPADFTRATSPAPGQTPMASYGGPSWSDQNPPPDVPTLKNINPADYGFVGNPLMPDQPPPINRNLKGEGRNALKGGLLSALAGLLLTHGDVKGGLAGFAGGTQGGLEANQASYADQERQRQEAIAAGIVPYQNDVITANNTNTEAGRKEAADIASNNQAVQQYGLNENAYRTNQQVHQGETAEQDRMAQQALNQAQIRRSYTQNFLTGLRGATEDQARTMLDAAEKNKDLDYMGLTGVFKKNADGTFDTSDIAKDSSAADDKSTVNLLLAQWAREPDPETKQRILDAANKIRAKNDQTIFNLGSGGGATIVDPKTAATIAGRKDVAAMNNDTKEAIAQANNAIKEKDLIIKQGNLDFKTSGGASSGKPMDPNKLGAYTTRLQAQIARAQNAYNKAAATPMIDEVVNTYKTGRKIPKPETQEETANRVALASKWAEAINGYQSELNRVTAIAKPNAATLPPPPPGTRTGAGVPFILPQPSDLLNPAQSSPSLLSVPGGYGAQPGTSYVVGPDGSPLPTSPLPPTRRGSPALGPPKTAAPVLPPKIQPKGGVGPAKTAPAPTKSKYSASDKGNLGL